MKRTYIVTGAIGHLASTVIERLRKQDCEIRGLILPSEQGRDDGIIRYYKGDVTQPETLDRLFEGLAGRETIVLHLAALISIQDKATMERGYHSRDIKITVADTMAFLVANHA